MGDTLVTLDADFSEFSATMVRYAVITGRSEQEATEQQAKLLVRDALKGTAPFETWGAGSSYDTWGEQRKIGQQRVLYDILKVFEPIEDLGLIQYMDGSKLKTRIHNYAVAGDVVKLKKVFGDLMPRLHTENIIANANPRDHFVQRDRRGRVRHWGVRRFFVARVKSVKDYIDQREKWVGYLKSGFGAAAERLGVKAPAWVLRGGAKGRILVSLTSNDPFITITNDIPYAAEARVGEMIELLIPKRKAAMERQIEAKLAGAWGQAGGGKP